MKRKVLKPNVVRGGIAIPLGANYYYMSGRKHKDGGIDVGNNPRTGLEVEDGEIMHINKNEAKVFSAVPFLNGKSPAQKVMGGENPNDVFKQQEKFKDINNINDDGTKKESERRKAYFGSSIFGLGSSGYKAPTHKEIIEADKKRNVIYKQKQREKQRERERERERRNKIIKKINTNTNKVNINKPANKVNTNNTNNKETNINKTNTNNKIKSANSFANAFRSARKEGKDIFEWNGKKYTTKLAGETKKANTDKSNNATNTITPNSNLPFGNDIIQNYINPIQLEKENEDIRKDPFMVKMRTGGIYSVTSNGKTNLRMLPSTGERTKAYVGTKKKFTEKDKLSDIKRTNKYVNDIDLNGPKSYKAIAKQVYGDKYKPYKVDPKNIKLDPGIPAFNNDGTFNAFALETAKRNGNRLIYNKYNKENNDKQRNINDIVSDSLGITSNIIGSTISHNVNKKMLNKLKYNKAPINFKATKLKTNININPQLDKMRESLASYERDIDNNTASSRVALARKQRGRINNMLQTNELYGEKENNETELINKDRINQQSIINKNIEEYNNWRNNKVAFENAVAEKKSENDVGLINSINSAVQDIIGRRELRGNERQTRLALMAANPNVSPRLLKAFGIKGITDEDIENFDKVHRRKIN